jgi:starch-binding outer membrane protein, SusD/RagB family
MLTSKTAIVMKHTNKFISLSLSLVLLISSCKKGFFTTDDSSIDPNAAPVESVLKNANRQQINNLAIGLQGVFRGTTQANGNGLLDLYRNTGTIGREIINSASTDNRYFKELLGTDTALFGGANDPAGIFNPYYLSFSQTRRRAEILIQSAENANPGLISPEEIAGVKGYAKTIQAFVTLNLLNCQYRNGIREGFSDLLNPGDLLKPGKFGTYTSGLTLCKKLIEEGFAELNKPGADFSFTFTSGWAGFNTVATFTKFNRAVAARIAMYQQDWTAMDNALTASFLNLTGSLTTGPNYTFSTTTGDLTNALFQRPDGNGAPYVVFDEFVADAEAGDTRVFGATAKIRMRASARNSGGISSAYEIKMYATNTSPISILRNEELVLMYAEAKIQLNDFSAARTALNKIRTTYGLAATAANTQATLIDELLNQRRYSLFFEAHRWFDMRRYNRLSQLPLATAPYSVFVSMSRPDAEVQWDKANP